MERDQSKARTSERILRVNNKAIDAMPQECWRALYQHKHIFTTDHKSLYNLWLGNTEDKIKWLLTLICCNSMFHLHDLLQLIIWIQNGTLFGYTALLGLYACYPLLLQKSRMTVKSGTLQWVTDYKATNLFPQINYGHNAKVIWLTGVLEML